MASLTKDSVVEEKGSTGHNPTPINPSPPPPPPTLQQQKLQTVIQLLILAGVTYLCVLLSAKLDARVLNSAKF